MRYLFMERYRYTRVFAENQTNIEVSFFDKVTVEGHMSKCIFADSYCCKFRVGLVLCRSKRKGCDLLKYTQIYLLKLLKE